MDLTTHAHAPDQQQAALEDLRRKEQVAKRAAVEASKRNSLEAFRLTNEWREALEELRRLERSLTSSTEPLTPWTREHCLQVVREQIERNQYHDQFPLFDPDTHPVVVAERERGERVRIFQRSGWTWGYLAQEAA